MQRTPAIQVKAIVLTPPMATTMQNVAGQLAPSSRKTYTIDAKHFAKFLASRDLSLNELHRDDLVAYRAHLAETYAQSTAARMWAVARRLLDEAVWLIREFGAARLLGDTGKEGIGPCTFQKGEAPLSVLPQGQVTPTS